MSTPDQPKPGCNQESDRAIEQEIRQGRKFSIADAIGKEGSDFLKGESPIPRLLQVKNALLVFIRQHLHDPSCALQSVLQDLIQSDDVVCSRCFDTPLDALIELLQPLTTRDALLHDFVRQVDMRWGQIYDERPYFKRPGHPPHPDDEYPYETVRSQLLELVAAAQLHQASSQTSMNDV